MPAVNHPRLARFLADPARPANTLRYHELQGFLFAVASAPEVIPPSEWLPRIFGEAEAGEATLDHAMLGQILACASRIPNTLAASRLEAPLRGAWRLASDHEVRSHASLKDHTLLTFAGGHMGGPCRAEQCPFGLPLPGLGPAPSGGLTTNSRRTGGLVPCRP